jgi:hypothetical protein
VWLNIRIYFPAAEDKGDRATVEKASIRFLVLADIEIQPEEISSRLNS